MISYVYADRIGSVGAFADFMKRRIARLVPLHLVTFVVAILVTIAVVSVGATYRSAPSFDPRCIAVTAFLLHEIVPCGGLSFKEVSWSISVEFALYAVFPLLVFGTRRSALLAFAITALAVAVLAMWGEDFATNWYAAYQPIRGVASFAFGMGLYHARARLALLPASRTGLSITTVALVVAMFTGVPLGFCLILIALVGLFAVAADMRGRVHPAVAKVAPLGQLTYSLYMIHYTFFIVLLVAIGDKILKLSALPMLGMIVFAFLCVFVLSYLSLQFLETPARKAINRMSRFSRKGSTGYRRPPDDQEGSQAPSSN